MTDQELRAMIRDAIARHIGPDEVRLPEPRRAERMPDALGMVETRTGEVAMHASHARLPLRSGDDQGACLIEPAVRCNHCGYCLSLGH